MNLHDLGGDDNLALRDIIEERIRNEGPISFADFMRLALYHPVHGYYSSCDPTLDYHSSPNVHPVFGAAIARQLTGLWRLMGSPVRFEVFEAGAGSGRLAADVLRALRSQAPELYDVVRYVIQDVTLGGDAEQRLTHAGLPPSKVEVAAELPPAGSMDGVILSNELLDALPFHRIRVRDGRLLELRAGLEDGRFTDVEAPAAADLDAYFAGLGLLPGEGCDAEVSLEAVDWTRRAAAALRKGYVLTLDYGYEARALYAAWRKRGTLLTFYRHTSGDDPYVRIGHQDVTASVDFTTVRNAGESAGLKTLGLTTQTDFLVEMGIGEALQAPPAADAIEAYYALRRAAIELTDASGLGRIRVLLQGRGVPGQLPPGFAAGAKEK